MRRTADPRHLAKLVQVQHARRAAAQAALVDAAEAAAQARSEEQRAVDDVGEANQDWLAAIEQRGFSPEFASALATRLIARETVLDDARETHRHATDDHAHRQHGWRLTEAAAKSTEDGLSRAHRDAARNREEKRMAELSDRVTHDWMNR
jgi:hypothetical protein